MAKYTEAQKKAMKKYMNKKTEIKIILDPDSKEKIKILAKNANMSISAYMISKALN